jgi:hypothetical protein
MSNIVEKTYRDQLFHDDEETRKLSKDIERVIALLQKDLEEREKMALDNAEKPLESHS